MDEAGGAYRAALQRLYALGPGRMQAGRGRLRRLLSRAGDPHLKVPGLLVGGTNGKGRVAAALSAVLSSRYRVGAFIKPHLKTIRERWRLNDQPVSEEAFSAAAERCCDLIEQHAEPISFFEANVLLGALLFSESDCDIAIWEIGLGGAEDACNLVEPLVSVLTNVGYDHQQILGETLSEIARDKARICREGRPLLLGPPRPGGEEAYREYAPVVREVCAARGARLKLLSAPPPDEWQHYLDGGAAGLPPDTFRMVTSSLSALADQTSTLWIGASEVLAGLARVSYRGRMERSQLGGRPVLLDAAHNVDSLGWLARVLTHADPEARCPVVFGCQSTRDPAQLLARIRPAIEVLVPVEVPMLRPCPLRRIVDAAETLSIPVSLPACVDPAAESRQHAMGEVTELDSPDNRTRWIESVEHALSLSSSARPTVICGSIYYLGEILRAFEDGWRAKA
jgi:dihydrofolate synthase/folylpolyglutamate synthase